MALAYCSEWITSQPTRGLLLLPTDDPKFEKQLNQNVQAQASYVSFMGSCQGTDMGEDCLVASLGVAAVVATVALVLYLMMLLLLSSLLCRYMPIRTFYS